MTWKEEAKMTIQPEEIKIVSDVNCKNSPKKELLRDLNIATVKQQLEAPLHWLEEEVEWNIIGDENIQDLEAVEEKLKSILKIPIQEFHIDNIITHGNTAALNGKIINENQPSIDFCHIYLFKGHSKTAKIKKITSYLIETN